MKKNKILNLIQKHPNLWVYVCYVIIFLILFYPARHGLGLFWDWNWPFYRDHLEAYFTSQNASWSDADLGHPLSYVGSYYFDYLLSLTRYLPLNSETVLYLFLIALTSATSLGGYLFARQRLSLAWSVIIGLALVINPAYFYKLAAGHISYLASYFIFVYLIFYLYFRFKNDFRSGLMLALLFAFVGIHIQFFIFAAIAILVYYGFNSDKLNSRYLWLVLCLAFLINLPWLSNFLVGANQIIDSSSQAGAVAFEGSTRATLLRILTMSFSDATLLKYFYTKYLFVFFGLFNLGIVILIGKKIIKRNLDKIVLPLIFTWLIYIFLGTGFFNKINIPVISIFYPMLRESGHFAPLILLFGFLSLVFLLPQNRAVRMLIYSYSIFFIVINSLTIYQNLPTCNFSSLRVYLNPYKTFLERDKTVYRFLSYPFFGQYSFIESNSKQVRGQPVRNSGIDSFSDNSSNETISNYIMAQTINQTLQFKLAQTHNLAELKRRNVKYLLDFSAFYRSNIEKYSEPADYNNNLSLVRNDSKFFEKLIAENPGQIKEAFPNIYEILALPRLYADGAEITSQKVDSYDYKVNVYNLKDKAQLNFLNSYHPGWKIITTSGDSQLFESSHKKIASFGQSWQLNSKAIKDKFAKSKYSKNPDDSIDTEFKIYFAPQKSFLICRYISLVVIFISAFWLIFSKSCCKNARERFMIL